MTVNLLTLIGLPFLLVLDRLAAPAASGSKGPARVCNVPLLNALRLTGFHHGEHITNNTICGIPAKDNCCSQIDEIKILRSWNSFTLPKLTKYADDMGQIYNSFATIEPYLARLNTSQIEFHFDNISWRRTNESQCFNGKYFLEQANYDLLKSGQNVTDSLISAVASAIAGNFSNSTGAGVILANETARIVREIFANSSRFRSDFLLSLQSTALNDIAVTLSTNLTNFLMSQSSPLVTLPTVPDGQTPFAFFNSTWGLLAICNTTLRSASRQFFLPVMQTRISRMHVVSLLNYLTGTLQQTLQNNFRLRMRQVNVTQVISDIADEMFADEALKRYFSWFYIPTSRSRYIRVYKYLENRFYKIFSDVISRTDSLSQHAQYAVLKEVMAAISDSSLRSILWTTYSRIAGTFVTHLALNNYTQAVYDPTNTVTNGTMFLALVRDIYNNTWTLDPNQALNQNWWVQSIVRSNLANVVNRVDANNPGVFRFIKWQPNFDTSPALTRFVSLNFRRASYAEFAGDNQKVCATVYRHNLVREAIFNENKFQFCLNVTRNYRHSSLVATLGPLNQIQEQIQKLLKLKSAFYCSACSMRRSRNIDVQSNALRLSSEFCFDFVNQFKTYLDWRYTVFQDFQFQLFQYLSCFGRNANLTDTFPYASFDNLLPDNFTAWNNCKNVSSINNISLCFPVCSRISLTTFSAVIEGDRTSLQRLYNYAVTVLRQYGVQFGVFDPNRNYTNGFANLGPAAPNATNGGAAGGSSGSSSATPAATGGSTPRLLSERKRLVVYHLKAEPRQTERILQGSTTQSSGGSTTSQNGTNSTNGTNKTNGTNHLPVQVPASLLSDPKIEMLEYLLSNLDTLSAYTQKEHYNHDEMADGRVNYQTVPPISDFRNMTATITRRGIDPFKMLPYIKFDEFMFKIFVENQNSTQLEPLDRQVIKDCVRISHQDVHLFNDDVDLDISPDFKKRPPHFPPLDQNEWLFARYSNRVNATWSERPPGDIGSGNGTGQSGHSGHGGHGGHHRQLKQTKKTARGSFVSNLLFKVLF